MRAYKRGMLLGVVAVVITGVLASSAAAVVLHSANGQFFGVALRHGVAPSAITGMHLPAPAPPSAFDSNGNMNYNGGPVLHSSSPYLIVWDPSGKISAASLAVMSKYMTDVAAASGKSSNVYSVLRQYTDAKGFANYAQTFKSSQEIVDAQTYPANGCHTTTSAYPVCLTDGQVQTELKRLIAANKLPTGIGARAPMYAVITPQNVNICFDSGGSSCASNAFCAYHSNVIDNGQEVLYSIDPFIVWALDAKKGCQTDGTANYQTPNAEGDHAYQIMDNLSHENSETTTDPLGTAWYNTYQGNGEEVGDNCATYGATSQPLNGISALAYAPTLGGTQSAGTLFDQVINGDEYYNQTEWSNGDVNCKAMNTAGHIVATFAATGSLHVGQTITFNPAGSSSTHGFTSTTWNFGDGKGAFSRAAPATVTHVFATAGTFNVRMSLVDNLGNLQSATKAITIAP